MFILVTFVIIRTFVSGGTVKYKGVPRCEALQML